MQMPTQGFLLKVCFPVISYKVSLEYSYIHYYIYGPLFLQYTSFFPSCIKHCLTVHHTAFICAEIAAKQGPGDVSML